MMQKIAAKNKNNKVEALLESYWKQKSQEVLSLFDSCIINTNSF